jgi:lipoprotein-anchoring transpeptidase ErfK/SrfK
MLNNPFLLAALAFLALSACTPDPKMIEAGLVAAPEPKLVEGVYGAKDDGAFAISAVPVEKVPAQFQRASVYYPSDEVEGTVVINPTEKHLYLITGKNRALRYGISVGRDGFEWAGTALITSRQNWPTWTPPPEMIARKPELSKWEKGQPGGPENPLGARALYLTTNGIDYGYRIHGTPEWFSIGQNASSGCFRMINQDVMDLFERVQDGAKVVVLNSDGSYPTRLVVPPPQLPKEPEVTVTPVSAPVTPAGDDAPLVLNPALLTPPVQNASPAAVPAVCAVPLVNGLCPAVPTTTLPLPSVSRSTAAP